ncbi:polymer-forming cytoskeletal protein [Mucilaginibacter sp. HMF5004]|uniref:bactofilin family protein n=1 Tax=Mucilaginibacter rivuli TaxID=2857527 RepID=UPI001C5F0F72|nr:polymer-forming cytoskeletal protein [Mucilaginibacter rivuli]MBW4891221.1 polymer-forming cytoskeletal protein [Mucilaginibacter rivuli]
MSVFNKKSKAIDQQVISTLISTGCVIEGNIKAPNFVRIDGQVNGDVKIEEGLILGETGVVHGNIFTREIIVYGTVNGNIQADALRIQSTGKINGDIKTQTLQVEMGAVYNGKISTNGNNIANSEHKATVKRIKEQVEEVA